MVEGARTAAYTALLDAKGECQFGIGDMDIHAQISPEYVKKLEKEVLSAPLVVADGNMPQESLLTLMGLCHKHRGTGNKRLKLVTTFHFCSSSVF